MALVEPPLQLGVGALKIGGLAVEDHGHLLTPLRAGPSRMVLLILTSTRRRSRRVADRCHPGGASEGRWQDIARDPNVRHHSPGRSGIACNERHPYFG